MSLATFPHLLLLSFVRVAVPCLAQLHLALCFAESLSAAVKDHAGMSMVLGNALLDCNEHGLCVCRRSGA